MNKKASLEVTPTALATFFFCDLETDLQT